MSKGFEIPKDVIYIIFKDFDGRELAHLREVCVFYRRIIDQNERFKRRIDLHLIVIDHPCEFMEILRNPEYGGNDGCEHALINEGSRSFWNKKTNRRIEFNDFYSHGPINLSGIPKSVKNFIVVKYEMLGGEERFQLPEGMGTLHRGTSVCLFY